MSPLRHDELPRGAGDLAPVEPIPAASVIVLRPAATAFELLMIRRHERASFVPNAWVFPGGAVDQLDRDIAAAGGSNDELAARRVAGVRELFEEAGLWLGAPLADAEERRRRLLAGEENFRDTLSSAPVDFSQLVWTSHFVTPAGLPKRFDAWFFLVRAPEGAVATVENSEAVDVVWITPTDALTRNAAGDFEMVFPTVKNLEALRGFASIDELFAARAGAKIPRLVPVVVVENGRKKIVLP